ncbi:hypothetical protein CWE13_11435 [Aliidiomarina shirensis]|uniref:HTH cro/C1-type domain-containing protein n=1 Tax=Aliidiomarina shirensis TaxID=1048642 RepID=A0A432WP22_9GAMM|nr:helix-turn-helix transcriptional regulator [Aliidiomarina shirensis]RUO35534.1 hypothetical protein CWE13_11435 [Aliidiomarina shirensis]
MTLGERLKQRRNELDLSQPALAERMGIEQSFLSKLENDRSLPSNDTFRGWIAALNLSLAETLEPLEMSYIHSKLRPIADIEQYVSKNSARQLKERQRLFRVSAIALALAFPLFYSGFTANVFPEHRYEYMSYGTINFDESKDIYRNWRTSSVSMTRDEANALSEQMTRRLQEQYILTFENRGSQYSEEIEGSDGALYRTWYLQPSQAPTVHRPINGLLQGFGLAFAVFGILGLWRERKLYVRR